MKTLLFPSLLLLASAALAESPLPAGQLTLDPERYAEALNAVRGLPLSPAAAASALQAQEATAEPTQAEPAQAAAEPAPAALPAEAGMMPDEHDWQAAMCDAGTELADVRLLVLLQRLNPQAPPATRAEDYAEVLRLHHLMLAGNARACLQLARACHEGRFENGLLFIRSLSLAELLQRRAASFQLPLGAEAGR